MRLLILCLFIGFYACGQKTDSRKHSINPAAKNLNDSAMSVAMYEMDLKKAIALLDQAIQIDSNYFLAYTNKLTFQLDIKQFDGALKTAFTLNRLKPEVPDYYVTTGLLYLLKNDSISAHKFFEKAAAQFNKVLDTMKESEENYKMILSNKALNLVFLGQETEGNKIFKNLYDNEKDEVARESIALFMGKSRQEILNNMFRDE